MDAKEAAETLLSAAIKSLNGCSMSYEVCQLTNAITPLIEVYQRILESEHTSAIAQMNQEWQKIRQEYVK